MQVLTSRAVSSGSSSPRWPSGHRPATAADSSAVATSLHCPTARNPFFQAEPQTHVSAVHVGIAARCGSW